MLRVLVRSLFLVLPLAFALLGDSMTLRAEDEGAPADDPRVATVAALEGAAFLRPGAARRWTLLRADDVVLPGDQLKTSTRGANALEVVFPQGGGAVLGPGTIVELPARGHVRLLEGTMEVRGDAQAPLRLDTPDTQTREVAATTWVEARDLQVRMLDGPPRWLRGYRESVGSEWMGSLVAEVDGRNVPLSVGYHKVTVDIRDQIARTTVEQSFVNATDDVLEGVFYFPLPADASISGFGMWIGGELVEADLVERSRARQIYEDILRRKKDPGLLEWQGGNLFKARVYPIPPHAEKRIRIRYTQVLRLEGASYRYRYALRSELLRANPLRRLDIQVNVSSTRPLQGVACASHPARIRSTDHEAQVTFDAEAYVPQRDFEVAVRVEPGSAVTAIANRRGEDGTFAIFLTPPEPEATGWSRDLAPEGDALDVIVVADTSLSMDEAARATQKAFLDAFLTQLGEDDRVRAYAADVGLVPLIEQPLPGGAEAAARVLGALDGRASLGWTDLDRALKGALDVAREGSVILYLGDGVPTTGDADPHAQAERIRSLAGASKAHVHAIATSSSYEQVVLEALAAGGGSWRRADDDPAAAARALLAEVAQTSLRDVTLRIEGVRTARVYPERLPNVPVGGQRIVLGRYLPTAAVQRGEIILSGTLGGESVTWRTPLDLPAADGGNDFLPRLWARRHLDHLLAQGTSTAIRDQVVEFSRRYGIITPHTSFLVLENDEERERYGVERTVQMRDGEAFFAEGRDAVVLAMRREAARAAQAWRVDLRRRMIREIAGLGRDLLPDTTFVALGELFDSRDAAKKLELADRGDAQGSIVEGQRRGKRGYWGAEGGDGAVTGAAPPAPTTAAPSAGGLRERHLEAKQGDAGPDAGPEAELDADLDDEIEEAGKAVARRRSRAAPARAGEAESLGRALASREGRIARNLDAFFDAKTPGLVVLDPTSLGFPGPIPPEPVPTEGVPPPWSPEALAVIRSLDRREALTALPAGLKVEQVVEDLHPLRGEVLRSSPSTLWVGPGGWLVDEEVEVAYLDGDHRALADAVQRLGRRRARVASDARRIPFAFPERSGEDLVRAWREREIRVEAMDEEVARLVVDGTTLVEDRLVLTVDRARGLLREVRRVSPWGRTLERTVFEDVVVVQGIPLPTSITTTDERGRVVRHVRRTAEALDVEAFRAELANQVAALDDLIWIGDALPTLTDAEDEVKRERPSFDARLVVLLHRLARTQVADAQALWAMMRESVAGRLGADVLDAHVQRRLDRGPALLARLEELASSSAHPEGRRAEAFAVLLDRLGMGALGAHEALGLLGQLEARWRGAGERAAVDYDLRRIEAIEATGDQTAARTLRAELAAAHPTRVDVQLVHARDVVALGRVDEAAGLLEQRASEKDRFTGEERARFYDALTDLLWSTRDTDRLRRVLDAYVGAVSDSSEPWRRLASLDYLTRRVDEADRFVLDNLQAPVPASPLTDAWGRLGASVRLALGNLWFANVREVHAPFVDPLVQLGLDLGLAEAPTDAVGAEIAHNYHFRRTDGRRRLDEAWRSQVLAKAGSLPPLVLARLLGWCAWGENEVAEEAFGRAFVAVGERHAAAVTRAERRTLGEAWERMARARGDAERVAVVLRARLEHADAFEREAREAALFDHLLTLPWSEGTETEIATLLVAFVDREDPDEAERLAAIGARRFAAWSFDGRRAAALPSLEVRKTLSRAAGRAALREAGDAARRGVVQTCARMAAAAKPRLAAWATLERLGYGVELGEDLPAIEAAARELLDGVPLDSDRPLHAVLAERAVLVLDYASTRRGADAALGDRTVELLASRLDDARDDRLDWRYELFRLLVALDRDQDLEARLRSWTQADDEGAPWGSALAQVLAASDRLAEAAERMEDASRRTTLSPAEFERLASWYLVLGDDTRRRAAEARRFDAMSEGELASILYQAQRRARTGPGGVPEDFEPTEVLPALRSLLSKASRPANYLWQVQRLYEGVRDHRLLESVVDGVPGHTPEGVYGFLQGLRPVIASVHEEATADRVLVRLDAARDGVTNDTDRRALGLLESMLRARAAQVPDAEPVHGVRAVAALTEAARGPYAAGERRHVAALLGSLGRLSAPAMADAQLAWLGALVRESGDEPPADRLAIAQAHATALAAYERTDDAVTVLATALEAQRPTPDAELPVLADAAFDQLIGLLAGAGHFVDAERRLVEETARRPLAARRLRLEQRRIALASEALGHDGSMRAGRGAALLDATTAEVLAWIAERPAPEAPTWVQLLTGLHLAAAKSGAVADAGSRLELVAVERIRPQLERLALESSSIVGSLAGGLAQLVSPAKALAYTLAEQARAPAFLTRLDRDPWTAMHWTLAEWRRAAGRVDAVEEQLLALVTDGLAAWLKGERSIGYGFWRPNDRRFWAEQRDAFAATAGRVAELESTDATALHRAAAYLRALGRRTEAVAVLASASERGTITDAGRRDLAAWLVEDRRADEALPVLASLRESQPNDVGIQLLQAEALHHVGRTDEALATLEGVEEQRRAAKTWTHDVAASLGQTARKVGRLEAGERWLEEAIRLREEQLGGRGAADPTLGGYFAELAQVRAALGRTDEAVDAASAAVVAWGRDVQQRARAVDALVEVLASAPALDAWVSRYEARVDEEGVDAPILRTAIAAAYRKRDESAKAVPHLLAARELAPEDAATHQALVALYDELGRSDDAVAALLVSLGMAPRNLDAAADLARRLREAGRADEAERALTSLAESLPHEAAGHRRLAELLVAVGRLEDAAVQWRQVVRTDPLDPNGWLDLAESLLALGDAAAARKAVEHVLAGTWESRFGDVKARAAGLMQKLDR